MADLTVTGDLADGLEGEYVVDERLPDGRLVIRLDTSAEAMNRRMGVEPADAVQLERHFGHLPTDRRRRLTPTTMGAADRPRFRVHFDDLSFSEDLRHATPAGREVARGTRIARALGRRPG